VVSVLPAEEEKNMAPVSQRGESTDEAISLEDSLCPVCLEIYMEPVTLPCKHTFCKGCFLESVDKASLCCPLCRKRVSTWARLNSKNKTLVNQTLWKRIQTCFPLQCQHRLTGQEADDAERPGSVCVPRVSPPGELRREYEDQVTRLREEQQVLDEEERKASEELIHKLLQEEEQLLQDERKRRDEDEQLARLLSNQLNSSPVCQEKLSLVEVNKKKKVTTGQIDRFLSPCATQTSSNKENLLFSEAEPCLPQLEYCGPQMDEVHLGSPRSYLITSSSAKRKSWELESPEEQEGMTKRFLISPSSVEHGAATWEVELQQRHEQEEEDRRLALLLQKELDEEERQKATDRSKGSCDAYLLRQKKGGREEVGTPRRGSSSSRRSSSAKTSKTSCSPSSSSSSSSRCSKQMTLTKMFSSLSN
ncbi:E3 ubiquitin-protein ligase rnf168, partial [Xenentodon cancila]